MTLAPTIRPLGSKTCSVSESPNTWALVTTRRRSSKAIPEPCPVSERTITTERETVSATATTGSISELDKVISAMIAATSLSVSSEELFASASINSCTAKI